MERAEPRRRRPTRECRDHERLWQGRCVDKNLQDDWLERLNRLSCFKLISICEGHAERRSSAHLNLRLKPEFLSQIGAVWEEIVAAAQSVSRAGTIDCETGFEIERRWRDRTERRREDLVVRVQCRAPQNGWNAKTEVWFGSAVAFLEQSDHFVSHELTDELLTEDRWLFAYGSNLWTSQKVERTDPIRCAVRCRLPQHRLVFNKPSIHGDVRASVVADTTHCVWGVAYLCDPAAISRMDDYEVGYRQDEVSVVTDSGKRLNAITYVATKTCDERLPPPEYLKRILDGARNHCLPAEYVRWIEQHQ